MALGRRYSSRSVGRDARNTRNSSFSDDRPGVLVEVMQVFSQKGINLTKVESRPSKEILGRYIFLINFDGHREDAVVKAALEQVRTKTSMLKIFGSYPRYNK